MKKQKKEKQITQKEVIKQKEFCNTVNKLLKHKNMIDNKK